MQWLPLTGGWSCPQPWRGFCDLGLDVGEDIDALAIDLDQQHMLFSTDVTIKQRNPILFFNWAPGCFQAAAVPYKDGGVDISDKLGLIGIDDVDAICTTDPSIPRRLSGRGNALFYTVGTPRNPQALPPFHPNGSAFRDYDHLVGRVLLHTWLVGWPKGVAANGVAVALITPDQSFLPAIVLPAVGRNPLNPLCGDPTSLAASLVIPNNLSLSGDAINVRWFPLTGLEAAEAFPVLFRL
jgi:hypothetical protein